MIWNNHKTLGYENDAKGRLNICLVPVYFSSCRQHRLIFVYFFTEMGLRYGMLTSNLHFCMKI